MALKLIKTKGQVAAATEKGSVKAAGKNVVKTKSGKGQPGTSVGKRVGKTTGLGVAKFQNQTLEQNRKKRLTDSELAKVWRDEFPNAVADYDESTVRGVRNLYNLGKHANNDGRPLSEGQRIPQYDENRQPMAFRGEKAAAKKAAVPATKASGKNVVVKTGKGKK